MKTASLRIAVSAAALIGLSATPAMSQDRRASTEQRLDRLERGLRQIQGLPNGQPAAGAVVLNGPAASQAAVTSLDQRLTAIERQLADIVRQSEENGHRAAQAEAELARLRTEQDERFRRLETAAASVPVATATMALAEPAGDAPPAAKPRPGIAVATPATAAVAVAADDPAELAYDEGYNLWKSGRFDQAVTSLRAMASSFPGHRRVSWANNLAGRALLDQGQARAAAEALLANYRKDPKGERAADSLFYLGQSLMKLGQPGQACKAYAELEDVYGGKLRGELQRLLPGAKAAASC